jgi:membrane dipeptidase
MKRRRFLRTAAALPLAQALDAAPAAGSAPDAVRPGAEAADPDPSPDRTRQARPVAIDGLGEIRLDYEPELLDEIIASGTRCCVVTAGNPGLYGADAFHDMVAEIAAYEAHIDRHRGRLSRVRTVSDIDAAVRDGTIGLVYYPQNATPLERDPARLETLWGLGVRIMQLTYNHRNLLGDGSSERTDQGLSEYGIEVVAGMNALGMLVDVSHSGERTTLDAIRFSTAPIAITHAGCKAVFDHPRNKTDEALRSMADKGGVVGIVQLNPYLGPRERNPLEDYLDHIDHAVNLCGIDHVGIGSDREHRPVPDTAEERQKLVDELSRLYPDPSTMPPVRWPFFLTELNHPRRMETIYDGLLTRGYGSGDAEKIMGGNWYRLFSEVWPA